MAGAPGGFDARGPGRYSAPHRLARGCGQTCERAVPESLRAKVIPLGMSASGQDAYVVGLDATVRRGCRARPGDRRHAAKIQPFANRVTDQADGSSDGGWLVWEETYSLQSLDHFTVYAWNPVTGRLLTLGHSLAGPGGVPWPSPWHPPAVSGHYAAWAQGYGPAGEVEVRLADLATGQVKVIRTGHTQPPFFDRSLLVWPESDRPGSADQPARVQPGHGHGGRAAPGPAGGARDRIRGHRRDHDRVPQS